MLKVLDSYYGHGSQQIIEVDRESVYGVSRGGTLVGGGAFWQIAGTVDVDSMDGAKEGRIGIMLMNGPREVPPVGVELEPTRALSTKSLLVSWVVQWIGKNPASNNKIGNYLGGWSWTFGGLAGGWTPLRSKALRLLHPSIAHQIAKTGSWRKGGFVRVLRLTKKVHVPAKPVELYWAHVRGWRAAGAGRQPDPIFSNHPTLGEAYMAGFGMAGSAFEICMARIRRDVGYDSSMAILSRGAKEVKVIYEREYICGHKYEGEEPAPQACQLCVQLPVKERMKKLPIGYSELPEEEQDDLAKQLGLTMEFPHAQAD